MKKIIWIVLIIIALGVMLFIIAGTPICLNFILRKAETALENAFDLPVEIGSLRGNIFYAISVEGLEIEDIVRVNKIKISYNIIKLLSKEIEINSLMIDGLHVDLNKIDAIAENLKSTRPSQQKPGTEFVLRIKELLVKNSNLFGQPSNKHINASLGIRARVLGDILEIDYLTLKTVQSDVLIAGRIPISNAQDFDLNYNINLLTDEFDFPGLHGKIMINGTVKGSGSAPRLSNSSELDVMYQDNKLSGFINIDWQMPILDSMNLDASLKIVTPARLKKNNQGDVWNVEMNTIGKRFDNNISSSHGHIKLEGSVEGKLDNPQLDINVDGKFKYAEFSPKIIGRVLYKNHILQMKDFKVISEELLVSINALIDTKEKLFKDANVLIACSDLGLTNNFVRLEQPITGRMNTSFKILGPFDNLFVDGKVVLDELRYYKQELSSINLNMLLKNHVLNLDSCVIKSPRGSIEFNGHYNTINNEIALHTKSKNLILNSSEIFGSDTILIGGNVGFDVEIYGNALNPQGRGEIVFENFEYDNQSFDDYRLLFNLEDSIINVSLSNINESIFLELEAALYEPIPFQTKLTLDHFDLKEYLEVNEGFITAQISAQGDMRSIERIAGSLEIDSLHLVLQNSVFKNMEKIEIDINEGMMDIKTCVLAVHNQMISISGKLPFDFENDDVNLFIKSSRVNIADVVKVFPDGPNISGIIYIDVDINGNLRAPRVNGKLNLENLKYPLKDVLIDSVNGLVEFKNTNISIDHLGGKINQGTFNIKGYVNILDTKVDTMFIELSFNNVNFENKDFGKIELTSAIQAAAKNDSFHVSGEVVVDKAVYDAPFNLQTILKLLTTANRPPQEKHRTLNMIQCDIGVSAPLGVQIDNNIADVEVGLDLQLKGYLSRLNVYGTLTSLRKGYVQYLNKKFEIINATIQFDDPYQINPVLHLEASTFVSSVDGDYEIFMNLDGTAEKWHLALTSSPDIPEQDIISILLVGRRRPSKELFTELRNVDLKGAAKDYAIGLVRGTIEKTTGRALGLKKFTITGDLLEPKTLDIGIEKRFGKRLTLIYGTGLETWELRRIGVNYDLTDNIAIYSLHDQENLNTSVDLDFHFKIK